MKLKYTVLGICVAIPSGHSAPGGALPEEPPQLLPVHLEQFPRQRGPRLQQGEGDGRQVALVVSNGNPSLFVVLSLPN